MKNAHLYRWISKSWAYIYRGTIMYIMVYQWYTYIGISQLAMDFPHSTFPIKARCLNAERLRADGIPGNHLIQGITGQSIWVAPEMGFQDGETYGSKTCETYREYSMGVLTYIYIFIYYII